jgi:predicted DNA-binding transcriptional regulator AlpA
MTHDRPAKNRKRRLIRLKEAQERLLVGHSSFYKNYVNPGLLKLVHLGPTTRAVVEEELDALIEARIAERDAEGVR